MKATVKVPVLVVTCLVACSSSPIESKTAIEVSSISQNLGKMAFEQMEQDTIDATVSNQLWTVNTWSDIWAKFQMDPVPDGIFYLQWQLWYAPYGQPQALFSQNIHAYDPCSKDQEPCPLATGETVPPGYDLPIAIWDSKYINGSYCPLSNFAISGEAVERLPTGSRWEVLVLRMDGTLVARGKLIIWWH